MIPTSFIYFMLFILILFLLFCYSNTHSKKSNIQKLIRQTARWATAADQDTNPYIKNLHANYAMGYLMALKEIYTESEINLYGNINIRKLDSEISLIMDESINLLSIICPSGQPKNIYLSRISKEGPH
jgi:di/tricarboxylate transporter